MEIVEKPDFQVFASEAKSGEVLSFPDVPRGWGISLDQTQGKPPLEWMNGAFKRVDLNNLYLLQQGLPAWNSAIKYPVNSIIKHLDKVYLCVKENINSSPTGNSSDWVLYVKNATTTQKGIAQLTSTIDDSEDKAATPKAVNDVSKLANSAHTALAKKLDTIKVKTALSTSVTDVPSMKLLNDIRNELLSKEVEVPVDRIFIYDTPDGMPPEGEIVRNGQKIDPVIMPKLFARYGANMPDDRDRAYRMSGPLAGNVGTTQEDAIQNITGHTSTVVRGNTNPTSSSGAFTTVGTGNVPSGISAGGAWGSQNFTFDASRVARTADETRVKARIVIFCNKIQ